ncbi:MAG: ATP-binding cassette domain-containing protein, partial [Microgenomates group bacterium]
KHFSVAEKAEGFGASVKSLFKRKYKKVKAVDKISFEIKSGEMVGFLGPNGAGKTTTLKMLSGILYPSFGTVSVLGYNPTDRIEDFQKQISMVMGQKNQLWWDLPPIDGFLMNREIYQIPHDEYKQTLAELVEILDISDVLNTPVRKMSLGQRMKCELIASLLHKPKVLFLDEPTIGLDIVTQKRVREFLRKINKQFNTTIILTSHNMEDVQAVCERIIMIDHGHKVYDGSIAKLISTYATEKYLQVDFESEVSKAELDLIGKVIEFDGWKAVIAVPRKEHAKKAAELLTKFEVDNLDIQEIKLEDVILKHFSK